jgi:hypothetical protein
MNTDRTPPEVDPRARPGAQRRAASALVANYIHELSERHGGGLRGGGTASEHGRRDDDCDGD